MCSIQINILIFHRSFSVLFHLFSFDITHLILLRIPCQFQPVHPREKILFLHKSIARYTLIREFRALRGFLAHEEPSRKRAKSHIVFSKFKTLKTLPFLKKRQPQKTFSSPHGSFPHGSGKCVKACRSFARVNSLMLKKRQPPYRDRLFSPLTVDTYLKYFFQDNKKGGRPP